jgi:hypothetical protein
VLTATRPSQRLEGFEFRQSERCPGAAIQRAPDGSNPWIGSGDEGNFDCDPSTDLPGP